MPNGGRTQKLPNYLLTAVLTKPIQPTAIKRRAIGSKAIRDFLGYAFGGAATYVLYGLAAQTSDSAYDNAGMGTVAGVLALSTNMVFNAMLGQGGTAPP